MTLASGLQFAVERPKILPDTPDALNSFAPEIDRAAPLFAGHATHAPLASDIPLFIHQAPVPLAPVRAARGRALRTLTVLALLGTAGWAAYAYESRHPLELDNIAASASRWATQAFTVPAAAPTKALRLDPPPRESLRPSDESATSRGADGKADMRSNTSVAAVSEVAQPITAQPEKTGTSGSLAPPVQNVAGAWRLDTQTEASDSSLEGLTLHYEVTLAQDGDRVTGVGTKISDSGPGIAPGARTPVTMSGTIAGERLTLNFVERGSDPEARGRIVLVVDNAGTLRGRFSSSAAPSSGHVAGRRVSAAQ